MLGLGPSVSPAKSEGIWFYDKSVRGSPPFGLNISMAGETVGLGSRMKYLRLVIDSQFAPHFDSPIPKVSATVNCLCGLLPNIGGSRGAPNI